MKSLFFGPRAGALDTDNGFSMGGDPLVFVDWEVGEDLTKHDSRFPPPLPHDEKDAA